MAAASSSRNRCAVDVRRWNPRDSFRAASTSGLRANGGAVDELTLTDARRRYPQIDFNDISSVFFEPRAGYLMARRACEHVVERVIAEGGTYRIGAAAAPVETGGGVPMTRLSLLDGSVVEADAFVFACGPWLASMFPDILGPYLTATRQEVYYFGPPGGDRSFTESQLPVWIDFREGQIYGIPGNAHRGFKVADDASGAVMDPTTSDRQASASGIAAARAFLAVRFPQLAQAPLVGSEVCQYESSSDADFIIDRHPAAENVWIVGGGSGHGFKMGPVVGERVASLVLGDSQPEPRFGLRRLAALLHMTGGARQRSPEVSSLSRACSESSSAPDRRRPRCGPGGGPHHLGAACRRSSRWRPDRSSSGSARGCRWPTSRARFSRASATRWGSSRWSSASARSSASCSPNRAARRWCRAALIRALGERRLDWALMLSGFIIGLPVFFQVGLVLLAPVLFTLTRQTGTPLLRLGIPLVAGLSAAHGLVPPHPGPLAAIERLGADPGRTLFYSLIVGLPVAIVAGPLFGRFVSRARPCRAWRDGATSSRRDELGARSPVARHHPAHDPAAGAADARGGPGAGDLPPGWPRRWIGFAGRPLMAMLLSTLLRLVHLRPRVRLRPRAHAAHSPRSRCRRSPACCSSSAPAAGSAACSTSRAWTRRSRRQWAGCSCRRSCSAG